MRQGVFILAAGRVRLKEKRTRDKSRRTENTPRNHSSPATATTSRRRATKHVPHVSPYSHASIHPGLVEIGLVQLSQSVKTANVIHRQTDTQTDRHTDGQTDQLNNGTLYTPRYEESFLPIGTKRPRSLRSFGLASLLVER